MSKRLIGGVMVAVLLSTTAAPFVVKTHYGILEALCAAFSKDSVEYQFFGCFLLPAAKPHTTKVLL